MISRRNLWFVAFAATGVMIAAACTGNGQSKNATATQEPPSGAATTVTGARGSGTGVDFATASGIRGGDPDFNYSALVWQGYWLSRDHFGPFVMGSGAGIPFPPPMDAIQQAMQMIAQNPNDPVAVPKNMLPLQAVYASASPKLLNDLTRFAPLDFEGLRLDPASFDRRVTVRGQAETMLKESQWAHNFADPHFGDPKGNFGAQQRFVGMMVALLAQMQGQYVMQNLLQADGLYHDSDGAADYIGNWVMLHVLSDIAGLTGDASGRYANPAAHATFDEAATKLFQTLKGRSPDSAQEGAAAVRALVYRASTTKDAAIRDLALAKARAVADGRLTDAGADDVVANAAAIVGLVAIDAVDNDGKYRDAADSRFSRLAADFDATNGVFRSKSVYSVDDVAWIIGGLNFLVQQGNDATKGPASRMLLAFYESTISVGGLQLSAPPGKDGAMAGAFEKNLPGVVYYHPAKTPSPPQSGTLPLPAEEIRWDGSGWKVASDRFVPAGAMHLANELNWLGPHLGAVPFPQVGSTSASRPSGGDASSPTAALTVVGQNILFDRTMLAVAAGVETTINFENRDSGVPHNFHIEGGTGAEFKTDIETGPVTQTLTFAITKLGTYTYICDVHPGQMKGTITVR